MCIYAARLYLSHHRGSLYGFEFKRLILYLQLAELHTTPTDRIRQVV